MFSAVNVVYGGVRLNASELLQRVDDLTYVARLVSFFLFVALFCFSHFLVCAGVTIC